MSACRLNLKCGMIDNLAMSNLRGRYWCAMPIDGLASLTHSTTELEVTSVRVSYKILHCIQDKYSFEMLPGCHMNFM